MIDYVLFDANQVGYRRRAITAAPVVGVTILAQSAHAENASPCDEKGKKHIMDSIKMVIQLKSQLRYISALLTQVGRRYSLSASSARLLMQRSIDQAYRPAIPPSASTKTGSAGQHESNHSCGPANAPLANCRKAASRAASRPRALGRGDDTASVPVWLWSTRASCREWLPNNGPV